MRLPGARGWPTWLSPELIPRSVWSKSLLPMSFCRSNAGYRLDVNRAADELSGDTVSGLRTMAQDSRITKLLGDLLDQLVPLRERFDRLRRDGPNVASQAARDGTTEVGRLALEFARLQWITGSDHLLTWDLVVSAGKQPWHGQCSPGARISVGNGRSARADLRLSPWSPRARVRRLLWVPPWA